MDYETNKVKGSGHEGLVAGVQDVGGTHAVRDDSGSAVDGGSNRSRGESPIAAPVDLTPEVLARWEELAAKAKGYLAEGDAPDAFTIFDFLRGVTAVPALLSGVRSRDARIVELEAVIEEAPHEDLCAIGFVPASTGIPLPCMCWKSRYKAGASNG